MDALWKYVTQELDDPGLAEVSRALL